MNPCPCGFRGARGSDCRCDDTAAQCYLAKLSGPLLDRLDLHVTVSRVSSDELMQGEATETSATIRQRVELAQSVQTAGFRERPIATNAAIPAADVRRFCQLDRDALALLENAVTRGALSARAFDRLARVARTIAGLSCAEHITRSHVAEALVYRQNASSRTPNAA